MKVMGHLMSIWGQRVLKEMVKEVSGHTYGPLITQCMVLKCSMVLAKGDFGTLFSLTHGIVPWYWRLLKYKRRQRQMEKACWKIWRFVLETV